MRKKIFWFQISCLCLSVCSFGNDPTDPTGSKGKTKKNSGQVTAEYLLLAVVLIILFSLTANTLRDNDYLKGFQDKPKALFTNMVENGNWEPSKEESQKNHPNQHHLHYTTKGEP